MSMETFQKRLDALYLEGDQEKTRAFLLEKIAGIEAEGGDPLALCTVYNELGGYYRGISHFNDSLEAFGRAAGCLETSGLGQSVQAATVMVNRAGTCRLMGDHDAAMQLYWQAGVILDANPQADRYLAASLCNNLSLSYIQNGRLDKALEEAQKGYEIVKTIPGSEHEQATSLVNLASVRLLAGELETAEEQVGQALAIYAGMPAPNAHYAAALNMLANVRARRGNPAGAREALLEALEYTLHFFGENIEAAITRQSLAFVCSALGDAAGAVRWQEAALEDMQRLLGAGDERIEAARRLLERYRGQD